MSRQGRRQLLRSANVQRIAPGKWSHVCIRVARAMRETGGTEMTVSAIAASAVVRAARTTAQATAPSGISNASAISWKRSDGGTSHESTSMLSDAA